MTASTAPHDVPGFEIRRELGRGAMGVVYLAHERALGRDVALKVLKTRVTEDEAVRARFEREVRAAARLRHRGIVPILSTGEANGHLWCAMEYVPGHSLDDVLHAEGGGERIHPARAARITAAVADALHVAHEAGVTHRDVKPGNVMLLERPVPKSERASTLRRTRTSWIRPESSMPRREHAMLADFGLAMDSTASKLSVSGMLIGTPGYMAPEQFAGERADVGPRADQWALGVMLYECLTGRLPFPSDDLPSLARFVMESEPVAPSRLDPRVDKDLETICLKALQKNTNDRYGSCAALADDLRHWLAEQPISARPPGTWRRVKAWSRRHPARAALWVSVAFVVFAGLALLLGLRLSHDARVRGIRTDAEAAMQAHRYEEAEALFAEWIALDAGAAEPRDGREQARALRRTALAEGSLEELLSVLAEVAEDTARLDGLERKTRLGKRASGGKGLGLDDARGSEPWWMREPAYRAGIELGRLRGRLAENRARVPTLIAVARSQADAAGEAAGKRGRDVRERIYTRAAAWHFEEWRRARRRGDVEQAAAHRLAVEEFAPGTYRAALEGRRATTLHLPDELVGAKAWLFRYVREADAIERGGPRLLPLPALAGDADPALPDAYKRAVATRLKGEGRRPVTADVPALAPPVSGNSLFVGTMAGPMRRTRYQKRLAGSAYPLERHTGAGFAIEASEAPLESPPGRYLVLIHKPGFEPVRVPFEVSRRSPRTIHVDAPPREGALGTEFVWIPGGSVPTLADEAGEPAKDAEHVWRDVAGFRAERFEVTYDAYWAFLNDPRTIKEIETHKEAGLRFVPRYEGRALPPKSGKGAFWPPMDNPEHPAMYLSLFDFVGYPSADRPREEQLGELVKALRRSETLGWGYLRWRTERSRRRAEAAAKAQTDKPEADVVMSVDPDGTRRYAAMRFTLPTVLEWERMARGGDTRRFVYGDEREWLCFKGTRSRAQYPRPEPVGLFLDDESVFGVRDLTGSVSEWTADWTPRRGEYRVKGSAWGAAETGLDPVDAQQTLPPEAVSSTVGFRVIVRTVEPVR